MSAVTTPVAIGLIVASMLYLLYQLALPKPLPGIPYNHHSARSLFGDLPAMLKHVKANHTLFDWVAARCEALNSPIIQIFATPFNLATPKVVLTDARESRDILMRRTNDFDRGDFVREVLSGVTPHATLVMPTDAKYKTQAKMLAGCMQQKFLGDVAGKHIWHSLHQLVELWTLKADMSGGHPLEAAEDLKKLATDCIWKCAFGTDLKAVSAEIEFLSGLGPAQADILPLKSTEAIELPVGHAPEDYEAVKTVNDAVEACTTSANPRLHHFLTRLTPAYRHAKARKDALINANLMAAQQRLTSYTIPTSSTIQDYNDGCHNSDDDDESHTTCATDIALQWEVKTARKENRNPDFSNPAIRDELLAFVLGGFDPTSKALCWLVKALAANHAAQVQVRESLYVAFSPQWETFDCPTLIKKQLPYLDAFIEETLRLSCVAQGQPRKAIIDTTILGYAVPKGTDVYIMCNAYGYRKPEFWDSTSIDESVRSASSQDAKDRVGSWDGENIEAFDIARWLKTVEVESADGREKKEEVVFDVHAGPSSPFGGGIRGCFGKKLAYLEMKIFLAVLLRHFEFLEVKGELANMRASQKLFVAPEVTFVRLRKIPTEAAKEGVPATTE